MRKSKDIKRTGNVCVLLLVIACVSALLFVRLPAQAAFDSLSNEGVAEQTEEADDGNPEAETTLRQPPEWWYDLTAVRQSPSVSKESQEQPAWWYVSSGNSALSTQNFTIMDIAVSLPGGQALNSGVIPLDVKITADGATPELIVQVTSEDVPEKAVYVGYEKRPDGAIQTLGGFQQARFVGGVGTDNVAEITFKYETLTSGWINFTVQVKSKGNLIYGPENHSVYISSVSPTFTGADVTVSADSSQSLNAAIPLNIQITADGKTPELVVQVTSEDLPDKAIYVGYEKSPDGAVQTLGGFQQARFIGGVGANSTAEVTFKYESLVTGWLNFTVQVWSGDSLIYGPQDHAVYVNGVVPAFTNMDISVIYKWSSRGLNAGAIPLSVKVAADGKTPELVVQVTSEDLPDKAIYVGYEKSPDGAVQTLGGFQQARFMGGVGASNTAEITFTYEALTVGWLHFVVQVKSEGHVLYGPEDYWIYIRETGLWVTNYPPIVNDFSIASQEYDQVTFNVDVSGDPDPQYDLICNDGDAQAAMNGLTCVYPEEGRYIAKLTISNYVDGVEYFAVATIPVFVFDHFTYLPLVVHDCASPQGVLGPSHVSTGDPLPPKP